MTTKVTSKAQLEALIRDKVAKSMSVEVAKVVKEIGVNQIDKDVYQAYTPISYKRRFSLIDSSLFKHNIIQQNENKTFLSIRHEAKTADGLDLSTLIILGHKRASSYGSGIAKYDDIFVKRRKLRYEREGNVNNDRTPFYEPRNFMFSTRLALPKHKDKLIGAFKKGMRM